MQKILITTDGLTSLCHEVEFVDMKHTLEWLLKTAEECHCTDAVNHLKIAQEMIAQKKRLFFG